MVHWLALAVRNSRFKLADLLETCASQLRGNRVRDVPAARKWMEYSSDAAELRWATSLARSHGASTELVSALTVLANHVKAQGSTVMDVALRGGKR